MYEYSEWIALATLVIMLYYSSMISMSTNVYQTSWLHIKWTYTTLLSKLLFAFCLFLWQIETYQFFLLPLYLLLQPLSILKLKEIKLSVGIILDESARDLILWSVSTVRNFLLRTLDGGINLDKREKEKLKPTYEQLLLEATSILSKEFYIT